MTDALDDPDVPDRPGTDASEPSGASGWRARIPVLGAGWAFPVALDAGAAPPRLAMTADEDSVRQSIFVVLSTARGERVMRPDFGCDLHELAFAVNDRTTRATAAFEVREALEAWEPRIELLEVEATAGGERGELLLIAIDYRVRSTDNRFNLVYPFYLDRPLA
jgi:phage baseplate assembly protein W